MGYCIGEEKVILGVGNFKIFVGEKLFKDFCGVSYLKGRMY